MMVSELRTRWGLGADVAVRQCDALETPARERVVSCGYRQSCRSGADDGVRKKSAGNARQAVGTSVPRDVGRLGE